MVVDTEIKRKTYSLIPYNTPYNTEYVVEFRKLSSGKIEYRLSPENINVVSTKWQQMITDDMITDSINNVFNGTDDLSCKECEIYTILIPNIYHTIKEFYPEIN